MSIKKRSHRKKFSIFSVLVFEKHAAAQSLWRMIGGARGGANVALVILKAWIAVNLWVKAHRCVLPGKNYMLDFSFHRQSSCATMDQPSRQWKTLHMKGLPLDPAHFSFFPSLQSLWMLERHATWRSNNLLRHIIKPDSTCQQKGMGAPTPTPGSLSWVYSAFAKNSRICVLNILSVLTSQYVYNAGLSLKAQFSANVEKSVVPLSCPVNQLESWVRRSGGESRHLVPWHQWCS